MFVRSFTENLMTYALGRRVEYADMPAVRAIVRDAAKHELPDVGVRAGRRRTARRSGWRAPDAPARDRPRPASRAARQSATSRGERDVHHEEAHLAPHGPAGHGRDGGAAVPRRDGAGAARRWRRRPPPGKIAARRASRWCTASAGSTAYRRQEEPVGAGGGRAATSTCRPSSLAPLEPFRDYLTIVSNTDVRNAEAFTPPEIGGDHFRSSAVFLTQSHPKQTQGSDVRAGTSLDQLYAQRFGQDTPIPSMQLCIENVDQAGGCAYGYSCVYTDTISWASPTEPLPMIRDPRVGVRPAVRRRRHARGARRSAGARTRASSTGSPATVARLKQDARRRPTARGSTDYLDDVREIERRIQKVEARNTQRRGARAARARRSACPTRSTSTSS